MISVTTASAPTDLSGYARTADLPADKAQHFPLKNNAYYYTSSAGGQQNNGALGVGTVRAGPWWVGESITVDRLFAQISAAGDALSVLRLGIWGNANGLPGDLLVQGTIPSDAVAVAEATVTPTVIPRGLVFIGGAVQGVTVTQPSVGCGREYETTWSPHMTTLPAANTTMYAYSQTGITGAFPASWGSTATGVFFAPRVGVRVSG